MNLPIMLSVLRKRRALRHREGWDRRRLDLHQAEELRVLLEFARERSPFYQRFYQGHGLWPFHELPVLTRNHVMEEFDSLVTDPAIRRADVEAYLAQPGEDQLFLDRYWVSATSGTTGRRGVFLHDRDEWTTLLASYARANQWAGVKVGLGHPMRLAMVSSRLPSHGSARAGRSFESRLVRTLRLDATDPIEDLRRELHDFQPEALVAYASMASALAEDQLAGRLGIQPRAVMTSSEVLTRAARRRIAAAWGGQPFDVYAASETGGIAAECAMHQGMHLFEDLVITEVVDERNRLVPPGQFGHKVLVTVLSSRTQPLIRYEMSDSLMLGAEPCPCGRSFALLAAVQGRAEDVLHLPDPAGGEIAIQPNVIHRAMDAVDVGEWQLVHQGDTLRLRVTAPASRPDDDAVARALGRELASTGAIAPAVVIEHVAQLEQTALGKSPLIRELR
jgi:phenylacetate-CoA ligase